MRIAVPTPTPGRLAIARMVAPCWRNSMTRSRRPGGWCGSWIFAELHLGVLIGGADAGVDNGSHARAG
jgi:hypothetical protein